MSTIINVIFRRVKIDNSPGLSGSTTLYYYLGFRLKVDYFFTNQPTLPEETVCVNSSINVIVCRMYGVLLLFEYVSGGYRVYSVYDNETR